MSTIRRFILLAVCFATLAGCATSPIESALTKIKKGMDRDSAILVFSDAIQHYECRYSDQIHDLFLFGTSDPRTADIVVVLSETTADGLSVYQATSAENSTVLVLYADCLEVLP